MTSTDKGWTIFGVVAAVVAAIVITVIWAASIQSAREIRLHRIAACRTIEDAQFRERCLEHV